MTKKGDIIILLDFTEYGTQNAWSKQKKELAL